MIGCENVDLNMKKNKEPSESGYYWIKQDEYCEWEIAYFSKDDSRWWLDGLYHETMFPIIDENRIMRDSERLERYLESKKVKV